MNFIKHTTYAAFIEDARTIARSKDSKSYPKNDSEDGGMKASWYGGFNLKETFETAASGWDTGIHAVEPKETAYQSVSTHYRASMYGSRLNFNNIIAGDPRHFYKGKNKITRMPRLNVYIYLNCSGSVSGDKRTEYAKSAVEYIAAQNENYDLCVYGVFGTILSGTGGNIFSQVIRLKDYGEKIVLNNFAFAMHTSFYRRAYFKTLENTEHFKSGIGVPLSSGEVEKLIKSFYKESEAAVLLPTINRGTKIDPEKIRTIKK